MAADRLDRRHFQCLVLVQRWQQPRQAAGEQGLAGTGRPGEQQVVRPGRRQQQGALGRQLALHLAQVRIRALLQDQAVGGIRRQRHLAVQVGNQFQQVPHRIHHQPACQAGFFGILPWHHQRPACFACRQCRGQHALHRAQFARQRQFAQAFDLGKGSCGHLAIGGEDAQSNGQVIAPAILG